MGEIMTDNNPSKKIKVEELLYENKNVQLHPQGYSMYPLITPGRDEVVISPLASHKIRRGDVLLYRRKNGKLILHRVYKVRNDTLFFVGDNESAVEGPLDLDQVYGIMTSFIRKGRKYRVNNFLYFLYWQTWLFLLPFRKNIGKAIHKMKTGE